MPGYEVHDGFSADCEIQGYPVGTTSALQNDTWHHGSGMMINFAVWERFRLFAAQSRVAELFDLLMVESEMINPLVEICAGLVLHLFSQTAGELVLLEKGRNVSP